MAEDLFGGLGKLGGLMKGLSSFMPQDDPNTKIFNAQNELNELKHLKHGQSTWTMHKNLLHTILMVHLKQ